MVGLVQGMVVGGGDTLPTVIVTDAGDEATPLSS
ncbi:MAG: hypothetical protein UX94_C0014G0002 [Parcubacteria group bacterium GW2011_GWA2_47_21]|nr:MAG: hypothetical protein UX94_C0014G0002 [Parcubacteria group bacterium GW2011_GWA2_47_21]